MKSIWILSIILAIAFAQEDPTHYGEVIFSKVNSFLVIEINGFDAVSNFFMQLSIVSIVIQT